MTEYYYLKEGEIVQKGDEVDMCNDGWRDTPKWVEAKNSVGQKAPSPLYPSHRRFRRKVTNPNAYRVFDKDLKVWVTPEQCRIDGEGQLYILGDHLSKTRNHQIDEWYKITDYYNDVFQICRYTGRDDKDGEAIFEHDLIEFEISSGKRQEVVPSIRSLWCVYGKQIKRLGSALEGE